MQTAQVGRFGVFFNDGANGVVTQEFIEEPEELRLVALQDVNNDGQLDLISSNFNVNDLGSREGKVSVYFGDGAGAFADPVTTDLGTNHVVEDLGFYRDPDDGLLYAAASYGVSSTSVSWLRFNIDGSVTVVQEIAINEPGLIRVGHLDDDQDPETEEHIDFVVASFGTVSVFSGNGSGASSLRSPPRVLEWRHLSDRWN